jgi:hypothetical protein
MKSTAIQPLTPAVAQLPQTAYHAVGTPYAFVGLGRTNNYVEASYTSRCPSGRTDLIRPSSNVIQRIPLPAGAHDVPRVDRSQLAITDQPAFSGGQRLAPTCPSQVGRVALGTVSPSRGLGALGRSRGRWDGHHTWRRCLGASRAGEGESQGVAWLGREN